jgi:glucose-6-phosphate isomerase
MKKSNMEKTSGAIYNSLDVIEITADVVADLKIRALASLRKRFRLCMHHSTEHQTQEMVIVAHKDTYIPPHRHPVGKSESYHVIEGKMTVYFFDDSGRIIRSVKMGKFGGKTSFLYRLSSNKWHMPVPTSKWVVYHETYSGPFEKENDVEFPSWAPKESDKKKVRKFLASLCVTDR